MSVVLLSVVVLGRSHSSNNSQGMITPFYFLLCAKAAGNPEALELHIPCTMVLWCSDKESWNKGGRSFS